MSYGSNGWDPWDEPDRTEMRTGSDPGPQRKEKRRISAAGIVIAVLATIVAVFIALLIIGNAAPDTAISVYPEQTLPEFEYNWDDSYQDFFDGLYGQTATTGVNDLERAEPDPDVELMFSDGSGELSYGEIYDRLIPSIVAMTSYSDGAAYSWGSGVIFTEDGYIITNSHVLDGADELIVTLHDDREFSATLVGYDSLSDIAVVKIDCTGLVPAPFGDSSGLRVGDGVIAIGNPLGEEFRGTMTNGIVSAINREVYYDGNYMTLIQTNAAINEGNSGGALIDMSGRVIGITNMKMISYGASIEGIGFAIPSSSVKPVVDEIMDNGRVAGRPGIGVTVGSIPYSAQQEYDLPTGIYVTDVTPGSGADAAGVTAGDIIIAANGVDIYSSADLNEVKGACAVGDVITLTIWRDGEIFDLDVEIMEMASLF